MADDEKQAQSEIIERMAFAGFREHHERSGLPPSAAAWRATQDAWVGATRAMVAALAEAGRKIVTREPTEAMVRAGHYDLPADVSIPSAATWRAMWDAAE
jgi:hypothetical protein